ncbi:MAG TPA: sigma-70 family RNA polymerase sigma factor [Polyangiaceae bacterium]
MSVLTPTRVPLVSALDGAESFGVPSTESGEQSVLPRELAAERTARLLRDWFDLVWRVLLRFGVPEEAAEDAAQEVFLVASGKLDRIEPAAERQFLYAVAVRIAANFRRARGTRRETPLEPFERSLESGARPDVLLERKRARELLERVLDSMPEELRTAFVLFELEELSGPEVAEVLGIPLGTAASRLRRAREQFQAAIARVRRACERGAPR